MWGNNKRSQIYFWGRFLVTENDNIYFLLNVFYEEIIYNANFFKTICIIIANKKNTRICGNFTLIILKYTKIIVSTVGVIIKSNLLKKKTIFLIIYIYLIKEVLNY